VTKQYVEHGLPDLEHHWSPKDYRAAARVLNSLGEANPRQLPRSGSPISGAVFARLISTESLPQFKNKSTPVRERIESSLDLTRAIKEINRVYAVAEQQLPVFGSELAELTGLTLRVALITVDLMKEFLPTISPNDPTYATRMQGIAQWRLGLAQVITADLTALTERQFYRVSARLKLSGYLKEALPGLLPELTGPVQKQILATLKQILAEETDPEVQAVLGEVLKALPEGKAFPAADVPANDTKPQISTKMHRAKAGTPGKDGWYEAKSTQGEFTVRFPAPFDDFTQTASTKDGASAQLHFVEAKAAGDIRYTALSGTAAAGRQLDAKALDKVAEPYVKDGTLRSMRSLTLNGNSGIECKTCDGPLSAVRRVYFKGPRFYQIYVTYPTTAEHQVEGDVRRFLDSFAFAEP
jgi:hypothetical protein